MKRLIATVLFAVGLSPSYLQGQTLAPDLISSVNGLLGPVRVIVQFNRAPGIFDLLQVLGVGGKVVANLTTINGLVVEVPAVAVPVLSLLPGVFYVSPDRNVRSLIDNSTAAVNAAAAWQTGHGGAGIAIAIVDSGVSPHRDLSSPNGASRIVYSEDFTGGGTADLFGHGTHVAGIAAGNGANSACPACTRHLQGMAPDANIVNLRVLDANGAGKDSWVIQAIDRAIQLRSKYNIRVLNLSLGHPVVESYLRDPVCREVEAAWRAGIAVVVAAGNDGRDDSAATSGYATINSPANDPYVITVGAMKSLDTPGRDDDRIASYSAKGPTAIDHIVKPDLVAPGNLVVSLRAGDDELAAEFPQNAVPLSYYQMTSSTASSPYYFVMSGTSMATPVVSGAIADLLSASPRLTPDQVKAKLMKTAYKTFPQVSVAVDPQTGASYTSQYDVFTVGAGYLDLAAALADNSKFTGSALSPVAHRDLLFGNVSLSFDLLSGWNLSGWSQKSVFGNAAFGGNSAVLSGSSAVWGNKAMPGFTAVWDSRSPWDDSSTAGTRSSWGTNGLWGTRTSWGTNGLFGTRTSWGTTGEAASRSSWGTGGVGEP